MSDANERDEEVSSEQSSQEKENAQNSSTPN